MKLYVVVRNDLSTPQKAVQAGHAATEWVLENKHQIPAWNKTLVYVTAKDKEHLERIKDKFVWNEINCTAFYEPDIGNEITAIACLGSNSIVKKLPLLK